MSYNRKEVKTMNELKKIGKTILIEGAKTVALGAGVTTIVAVIGGGLKGLKDLKLDELLK